MHLLHNFKKSFSALAAGALLLAAPLPAQTTGNAAEKPFSIPEVNAWTASQGSFNAEKARLSYSGSDAVAARVAQLMAADYETLFGRKMKTGKGEAAAGQIRLSITPDSQLGDEGYRLSVRPDGVTLQAAAERGLYWGTRTLLQLFQGTGGESLPCGSAVDKPAYPVRGFMIDCGRKYIPMSYLRQLVKVLAYYKMNTLQVHLNDNGFKQYFGHDWNRTYAAFRLECDTYPGLTAADGSYTKAEFRAFQKEAAALGVEVIPEIDIPAHSLAFSHYDPELGSQEYGMDHLNLGNPKVYGFFDKLFKEYLEGDDPVFCGKRVHVGTDEYSNAKQEVVEQFRKFTDHYIRLVESYGKQAVVWGALTHARGTTPVKSENVVMGWWHNGYAKPDSMARLGYKGIGITDGWLYIVPRAGYYYDYLNTQWLYENWTPNMVGDVTFEKGDPAALGSQFAVWNDHVGNGISVKDIHDRAFPAIQTLSEKMWRGAAASLPYSAFAEKAKSLCEAPGVNELARYGKPGETVLKLAEVKPGSQLSIPEIGYGYSVTFVVDGAAEQPGTELFRSPSAVFYLSDPVSGLLGFARDGYLNTFRYAPAAGRRDTLTVEGDSQGTRLYVNGRLRDDLAPRKMVFNEGKDAMTYMSTLVFPLGQAGHFKSRVSRLKVENRKAE